MKSLSDIISEYKRLIKEAESSQGLDEEKIPEQLNKLKKEYEKLSGGKDITKEV